MTATSLSAVEAANIALGPQAIEIPQMSDVFKGKNFYYVPTYLMATTALVGIVITVAGGVMGNSAVGVVGGVFTLSSALGTYYSWRYLQTKPLATQVTLLAGLLQTSRKTVEQVEETIKEYRTLEEQIKGDNKTLAALVKEFKLSQKQGAETNKKQLEEAAKLAEKLRLANESYDTLFAQTKDQVSAIVTVLTETSKIGDIVKANLAALNQGADTAASAESKTEEDVKALDKENQEAARNRKELEALLKAIKQTVTELNDSYKNTKAAYEQQVKLLEEFKKHAESVKTLSEAETINVANLKDTAQALAQVVAGLTALDQVAKEAKDAPAITAAT